ncbi:MAG TPA: SRPBCC domain-containing protein [Candidatus Binatia bacterium]|jgi:uncharacterized protein YndB with AHSA1/START domain|nr:SRPBCC domain-containing protein [Candidatus Binatia bacterium]
MKQPTTKLVIKRVLKADRERVFSALTDPAKMAQWFYGMDTGQARVRCDFRVGGKYSIEMFNDEQQCVPTGEYLEIVPPEKVVFTWSVDGKVKNSKVTIELFAKGNDTELVLTHELPQDVREPHQHGWVNCLNHLEALLGVRPTTQIENK